MKASEILKEWIVEQILKSDEISLKDKECIKTFEDLIEFFDCYALIDVIEDKYEHYEKEEEEYWYVKTFVLKIKDKFISMSYNSDKNWDKKEMTESVLEGINEAYFVEPYQELVTYYKAI